jgi:hypothetical protein
VTVAVGEELDDRNYRRRDVQAEVEQDSLTAGKR